jgi:adenylate cyclase class 2
VETLEVELKFLGADLAALRQRLAEVGARCKSPRSLEVNVVFDDDSFRLAGSERLLRLRDGHELTVKIPVEDSEFKSREELTIHVADGDVVALLDGLGFKERWRYEKYREGWDCEGLWVTLDELPFIGAVVELEGDRDKIMSVAQLLGLSSLETSTSNYHALYDAHRRRTGMPPGDMTFAAETGARTP